MPKAAPVQRNDVRDLAVGLRINRVSHVTFTYPEFKARYRRSNEGKLAFHQRVQADLHSVDLLVAFGDHVWVMRDQNAAPHDVILTEQYTTYERSQQEINLQRALVLKGQRAGITSLGPLSAAIHRAAEERRNKVGLKNS